jgi:hypothetical protein
MNSGNYYLSMWGRLPWDPERLRGAVLDPGLEKVVCAAAFVESLSHEEARKARMIGLYRRDDVRPFLEVWLAEESEHGRALRFLAESHGLRPEQILRTGMGGRRRVSSLGLTVSRLSRLAPAAALGVAAAAEYLTRTLYLSVRERSSDETVRDLFRALAVQEGRHLGFFLNAARAASPKVSSAHQHGARKALLLSWRPVGVDRLGLETWLSVFDPLFAEERFRDQLLGMDRALDVIPVMRGLRLMHRFQARHLSPARRTTESGEPESVLAVTTESSSVA